MSLAYDMDKLNELEVYFLKRRELEQNIATLRDIEKLYLDELAGLDRDFAQAQKDLYTYEAIVDIANSLNQQYPKDHIDNWIQNPIKVALQSAEVEMSIIREAGKTNEFELKQIRQDFLDSLARNYDKSFANGTLQRDYRIVYMNVFKFFAHAFKSFDVTKKQVRSIFDLANKIKTLSDKFDTTFKLPKFATNHTLYNKVDTFDKYKSCLLFYRDCLKHIIEHANKKSKEFAPKIPQTRDRITYLEERIEATERKLASARRQLEEKIDLLKVLPIPSGTFAFEGVEISVSAFLKIPRKGKLSTSDRALGIIKAIATGDIGVEEIQRVKDILGIARPPSTIRDVIPLRGPKKRRLTTDETPQGQLRHQRMQPPEPPKPRKPSRPFCQEYREEYNKMSESEQALMDGIVSKVPTKDKETVKKADKGITRCRVYSANSHWRVIYFQPNKNVPTYVILDIEKKVDAKHANYSEENIAKWNLRKANYEANMLKK